MSDGEEHPVSTLAVFGLGKLGAAVAACHAARGFRVIGVDVDPEVVDAVRSGRAPVEEPGLSDLFASARERITATRRGAKAVLDSDASLLVLPTPSLEDGSFSLQFVEQACRTIGEALRRKTGYHLVVLKSTVMPGASASAIVPLLERASGKRCGEDFGYCYNPEFIALGSVVRDLIEPDMVLAGESDPRAGDVLQSIYDRLHGHGKPAIARMDLANAELTKLAVNTYVTMKITYANALAALCERLPGGDAELVTGALGLDRRIGPHYLGGGLGFGGPCFPRDNKALLSIAERLGAPFSLAEATDRSNPGFTSRVADLVASRTQPGATVAVLGLSYKPHTPVVEESQGLLLAQLLARRFAVVAYDPLALDAARRVLGDTIKYAESAQACIENASGVVVATAWPEFTEVDYEAASGGAEAHVYDCWGILRPLRGRLSNLWLLGVHEKSRSGPRTP